MQGLHMTGHITLRNQVNNVRDSCLLEQESGRESRKRQDANRLPTPRQAPGDQKLGTC